MKRLDLLIALLRDIYALLQQFSNLHLSADHSKPELEEWLDKEGVKRYLKIEKSTYYRWVKMGKLKPRGMIGEHRYLKSDLDDLFARRKLRQRG